MEVTHQAASYEGRLSDIVEAARDTIRRRWLTLVIIAAGVFALSAVAVFMMKPRYTAATQVRIDPSRNPLTPNQGRDADQLAPEAIETEVAVLSSLDVAREAVRKLKLQNDPEFAKGLDKSERPLTPDERLNAVGNGLLRNLAVSRDKLTYLISVKFSSADPVKAAQIANAIADTYMDLKVGSKVRTAESQSEWFKQRLEELGAEVRLADARVAQYRAQAGIVAGADGGINQGTIADQQVAPLSSQLATADSDAAAARANLAAAQQQVARGRLDSVAEVRNSPVIADLRRQRAEILRSMGEVEARYGPLHPESVRVNDQLKSIDQQISAEAVRAMGTLSAQQNSAEARAASLRNSMRQLEGDRARNTRASVMADSLAREATAKRAAYDKMSQMSLESTQAAQNQISQAVIVDRAQPPAQPSFPNKPLFLTLGLLLGVAAGIATIVVQEMLVASLRTVDDVETQLGIPVLAAVPKVPKSTRPADLLLEKPTSLFAESFRVARAAILGVKSETPIQVIAITSALPSEGKTTTALAFARTLAISNSGTLLLECDVRRAQMRTLIDNASTGPGIVELLRGEATLDETIKPSGQPLLDQLLVRAPHFSSENLFGNGAMEALLTELRGRYDMIVLDLPPLVGLADGRFLAVLADATALAIRWNDTPPSASASALGWLRTDGANPVGAIYTMVDSSAEAIGGLYYSKKYSSYYQAS